MVPLKDAWSDGANAGTDVLRADLANDLRGIQLIATTDTTNKSKSDSSIEEWQPLNTDYCCAYAEMSAAVKNQ